MRGRARHFLHAARVQSRVANIARDCKKEERFTENDLKAHAVAADSQWRFRQFEFIRAAASTTSGSSMQTFIKNTSSTKCSYAHSQQEPCKWRNKPRNDQEPAQTACDHQSCLFRSHQLCGSGFGLSGKPDDPSEFHLGNFCCSHRFREVSALHGNNYVRAVDSQILIDPCA